MLGLREDLDALRLDLQHEMEKRAEAEESAAELRAAHDGHTQNGTIQQTDAEARLQAANRDLAQLDAELAAFKSESSAKEADLQSRVDGAEVRFSAAQSTAAQATERAVTAQQALTATEARFAEAAQQHAKLVAELDDRLAQTSAQLRDSDANFASMMASQDDDHARLSGLQSDIEAKARELEELRSRLAESSAALSQARNQCQAYDERQQSLATELEQYREQTDRHRSVQDSLSGVQIENSELKNRIAAAEAELRQHGHAQPTTPVKLMLTIQDNITRENHANQNAKPCRAGSIDDEVVETIAEELAATVGGDTGFDSDADSAIRSAEPSTSISDTNASIGPSISGSDDAHASAMQLAMLTVSLSRESSARESEVQPPPSQQLPSPPTQSAPPDRQSADARPEMSPLRRNSLRTSSRTLPPVPEEPNTPGAEGFAGLSPITTQSRRSDSSAEGPQQLQSRRESLNSQPGLSLSSADNVDEPNEFQGLQDLRTRSLSVGTNANLQESGARSLSVGTNANSSKSSSLRLSSREITSPNFSFSSGKDHDSSIDGSDARLLSARGLDRSLLKSFGLGAAEAAQILQLSSHSPTFRMLYSTEPPGPEQHPLSKRSFEDPEATLDLFPGIFKCLPFTQTSLPVSGFHILLLI